jgi:multicomponent Na+:H+ antiporter subunit E
LRAAAARAAVLALLWLALTEAQADALAFGAGTVALATLASMGLRPMPPRRPRAEAPPDEGSRALHPRPIGLLWLVLYFLVGSLRGGIDVARRALAPRLVLFPTVVVYQSHLTPGLAQNLFAGCISLMPGTLGIELDGRDIRVHVLSERKESMMGLVQLERRVAFALGLPLPERKT